jgi:hypothetical protein
VRQTCRTLKHIISGTAYLQYIIHAYSNGVEDSLPPNFPYSKRLELLRRREQSWRAPRFDLYTKCVTKMSHPFQLIFQDGYLIYEILGARLRQYRYTDLYSAARNEELHWIHITMDNCHFRHSAELTFAVDHNLVVESRSVPLPVLTLEQNLTEVIVNSDLETAMLSGYSLPFSNSRLVHFTHSHRHILCCFHHFMGTTLRLFAQKYWEIIS